jgi:hypothetical protein
MTTKSRCSATIEAAMPDLPDLNAPEFAPLKARWRAPISTTRPTSAHRTPPTRPLSTAPMRSPHSFWAMARAMAERRHTWLLHYSWFVDLINELLDALPGKPLDG